MRLTNDRLAVARAVLEFFHDQCGECAASAPLNDIIAEIPEPPDDSPATLPAPTGPGWWWALIKGEWHAVKIDFMPGWADYVSDAWLPLVAPTAKGGAE